MPLSLISDHLGRLIAVLVAAGYHEPSSRDARRRIVAFFRAMR